MGEDGKRRPDGGDPGEASDRPRQAAPADSFGWRGWVLVGMIVLAFLVIPAAILVLPQAQGLLGELGLGMRDAYLVLPLPAAILLGAVAVWSALSARRD
jgi:ABC-type glycerol-3-phosphate transport system permease component